MVGGTILYALTSIFGYQIWKFQLPGGGSPGALAVSFCFQNYYHERIILLPPPVLVRFHFFKQEFCLYGGCFGVALPVTLRNIYRSYRGM